MSSTSQQIIDTLSDFPEYLRPKQLIELGLFRSQSQIWNERKLGSGPTPIRMSKRRIVFTKGSVIEWIKKKAQESEIEFAEATKKFKLDKQKSAECNIT